jgi:hypothetical protein
MNSNLPRIRPIHAVFCDDIRREINGKEILIGVYSGDLLVTHLPAPVVLAIWVPFERVGNVEGKIPIEFRMLDAADNNRTLGYGSIEIGLSDASQAGALSLPALAVMLNRPGQLVFQLKQHDEPWEMVASLNVQIRSEPSPITPASEHSPPSSRSERAAQESTSPRVPPRRRVRLTRPPRS